MTKPLQDNQISGRHHLEILWREILAGATIVVSPFGQGGIMFHIPDRKMILAEPLLGIHLSCAYDLKAELDEAIRKMEDDLGLSP